MNALVTGGGGFLGLLRDMFDVLENANGQSRHDYSQSEQQEQGHSQNNY